ncbi:MAG: hypothetical protein ABL901_08520 [Hyphomicrobiaceae bacterium]
MRWLSGRPSPVGDVRIEKLMSLSLREFQHSLCPLAGRTVGEVSAVSLPVADGSVTISYEARPSVRFGGLLEIPRAVVSLVFSGVTSQQQEVFMKRFDLAFQRGGG